MLLPSGRASATADRANDIIAATMYCSEADVLKELSLPADTFTWKTYGDKTIDSRDVAVYYALACGTVKNAEILWLYSRKVVMPDE